MYGKIGGIQTLKNAAFFLVLVSYDAPEGRW